MRASPACQVLLQRFGVWRAALGILTTAVVTVIAAWLLQQPSPVSPWLLAAGAVSVLASIVLAGSLARVRAASLRWDGRAWSLDDAPGTLSVALDLGGWMLLRYTPEAARGTRWLPVQRRGLETQWHLLRCAVYSPAPGEPR